MRNLALNTILGLALMGAATASAQDFEAEEDFEAEGDTGGQPLIEQRDYSPEGQDPEPPRQDLPNPRNLEVAHDAGVGGTLAYARATVIELGGTLALQHTGDITVFSVAPTVGYFLVDNFQLTLIPQFAINVVNVGDIDGDGEDDTETVTSFNALIEPSYHLPITEALYVFGGLGVGFTWADDPGFNFTVRPVVGVDILIGRSGILKPALYLNIGASDGVTAGGLQAGFTVMW